MINYTEDEKEYLREYLEQEQGITEEQGQEVELMQHYESMCKKRIQKLWLWKINYE